MDGWNTTFLLGRPIFRGYVSFREGSITFNKMVLFLLGYTPQKINGGFTWEYKTPPWKRKIIWTKPSFSGSNCSSLGVYIFFRWIFGWGPFSMPKNLPHLSSPRGWAHAPPRCRCTVRVGTRGPKQLGDGHSANATSQRKLLVLVVVVVTLQGTITYPTWGKGKSSWKVPWWGIC